METHLCVRFSLMRPARRRDVRGKKTKKKKKQEESNVSRKRKREKETEREREERKKERVSVCERERKRGEKRKKKRRKRDNCRYVGRFTMPHFSFFCFFLFSPNEILLCRYHRSQVRERETRYLLCTPYAILAGRLRPPDGIFYETNFFFLSFLLFKQHDKQARPKDFFSFLSLYL